MPPIEPSRLHRATWSNEAQTISTNTSTYTGNATALVAGTVYTVVSTTAFLFKQTTEDGSVTTPNYWPADFPLTIECSAAANAYLECKAVSSAGTVYIMNPV